MVDIDSSNCHLQGLTSSQLSASQLAVMVNIVTLIGLRGT
jgi:hypothetical protein